VDLGERCELSQWGLGQSPSQNRIWCILALNYDIWWHHFGPIVVDTDAKPLVHYWPRTTYVLSWQTCIGINVRACPLLRPWVKAEAAHFIE